MGRGGVVLAALLGGLGGPAGAAAQVDTVPVAHLDELVVVAGRRPTRLRETVAAATLLTRADIEALPARTLPDVLRTVPGLTFVDQDGSGRLPIAVARGFFGGGETSYVLLTVNGVPVNDGRTGLAEWTAIPLAEVERVEVLRGPASAAYGDAALGAVVNVVTRRPSGDRDEAGLSAGSWDGLGGRARIGRTVAEGGLVAAVDYDREDGYRAHSASNRLASSVGYDGSVAGGDGSVRAGVSVRRIETQNPGPLPPEALATDRRQSHPAFGGDRRIRREVEVTAGGHRTWAGGRRLEGDARFRVIHEDRVRTLLLTPTFGDTQLHAVDEVGGGGRVQARASVAGTDLGFGAEAEVDHYRSRYRVAPGTAPVSSGEGGRLDVGVYGEVRRRLASRLDVHAGVRFDAVLPDLEGGSGTSFHQWSPRLGVNLAWRTDPSSAGNLFVTWSRAFKAPTLDQLYDVRRVPSGEPGETFTISNDGLVPQRASSVEVGTYQRLPLGRPGRYAELSASWYRQEVDDEIDFDVRTYRYGNIVRSRHSGFEGSLSVVLSPGLRLDHAATVSRVTFRTSENRGNQLKNIPETSFVTSLRVGLPSALGLTLTHRTRGRVFLDDGNTRELEGFGLVDVGLRWTVRNLEVALTATNVLDAEYGSFGFLLFDPGRGEDVPMVHPGGGCSVGVQVRVAAR